MRSLEPNVALFLSKSDVRKIVREELAPLITATNLLAMNAAEATAKLNMLTKQVGKVRTEVTNLKERFEALEAAIANNPVHADVVAAIENLSTAIQGVDAVIPDAAPPGDPS